MSDPTDDMSRRTDGVKQPWWSSRSTVSPISARTVSFPERLQFLHGELTLPFVQSQHPGVVSCAQSQSCLTEASACISPTVAKSFLGESRSVFPANICCSPRPEGHSTKPPCGRNMGTTCSNARPTPSPSLGQQHQCDVSQARRSFAVPKARRARPKCGVTRWPPASRHHTRDASRQHGPPWPAELHFTHRIYCPS